MFPIKLFVLLPIAFLVLCEIKEVHGYNYWHWSRYPHSNGGRNQWPSVNPTWVFYRIPANRAKTTPPPIVGSRERPTTKATSTSTTLTSSTTVKTPPQSSTRKTTAFPKTKINEPATIIHTGNPSIFTDEQEDMVKDFILTGTYHSEEITDPPTDVINLAVEFVQPRRTRPPNVYYY